VSKHPGGGAEGEISVLFADVRGSTSIGDRARGVLPSAGALLRAAADVIDERDGTVDKFVGDAAVALFIAGFVGDAAVALFIAGFAGSDHAAQAIAAARALLEQTGNNGSEPGFRSAPASTPARPSSTASARAMPGTSPPSASRSTRPRA
jgi:adenylate cyclase